MVLDVTRRERIKTSRQQLHRETESRRSFILKMKKENFIKTKDNFNGEQEVEDTEKRRDNFLIRGAEKYEIEDRLAKTETKIVENWTDEGLE